MRSSRSGGWARAAPFYGPAICDQISLRASLAASKLSDDVVHDKTAEAIGAPQTWVR